MSRHGAPPVEISDLMLMISLGALMPPWGTLHRSLVIPVQSIVSTTLKSLLARARRHKPVLTFRICHTSPKGYPTSTWVNIHSLPSSSTHRRGSPIQPPMGTPGTSVPSPRHAGRRW